MYANRFRFCPGASRRFAAAMAAICFFFFTVLVPTARADLFSFDLKDERELGEKFNALIRARMPMSLRQDFIAHSHDKLLTLGGQPALRVIHDRCGFFQDGVSLYQLTGHQIITNTEINKGTLGLSAPEFVRRDLHFAQTIRFDAIFHTAALL